jgi:ribose-phosphate pyrophosphokinase
MKITTYPDGQKSATLDLQNRDAVTFNQRLSTWEDFQELYVKVAAIKRNKSNGIRVFAPYIFGSRSDRVFEKGGINYVKDVLAPMINNLGLESITCYDPHSLALENAINNLIIVKPYSLITDAISEITNGFDCGISIISPDFGAYKKVWDYAEHLNSITSGVCDIDIVSCEKVRSVKGEILKTTISHQPKFAKSIIIDDICDGGRTFIEISKALGGYTGDLHLFVTHGIFSKGFDELNRHFTKIYCTNSVKDIEQTEKLTQYQII